MTKTAATAFEVRWRKNSDPANLWSTAVPVGADGHVSVPGLERVTDYTFEARAISACGAKSAWVIQTFNLPDVPAGTLTLAGIATEVATAQTGADTANAQLADIASDNILSPAEKPTVMRDYSVITSEQAGIDGQAVSYLGANSTQQTDYDNAISTLTAYLNTLNSPVAWDNKSGNTDIVGASFRGYFNSVYTTRQTLLNAIYAAAKNGLDSRAPLVNNPYFSTGDLTGWTSDSHAIYFESGANGPAAGSSTYARRDGSSGTPNDALRNTAKIPVYPGALIKAQCAVKGFNAPNGTAGVRISWRGSNDLEIAATQGNTTTGNATNGTYVVGTAPVGSMFAHVECGFYNHTTGSYTVDNFWASTLADSMDQMPDGTVRFGAAEAGADKTSGKPLSSLSGRTMDYIGDSATRFAAAESGADKTAGKSIDILADGATYARPLAGQLQNGVLRAISSGRNLITNGGFELNVSNSTSGDGWDGGGGLFEVARANAGAAAHSGSYVLQVNAAPGTVIPTGQTFVGVDHYNIDAGVGDTLYFVAWFKSFGNASFPANITATLQAAVVFLDSTGAVIDAMGCVANLTVGGWQQVTKVKAVPSGTVSAYVQVLAFTTNNSGSAYTVPAGQYPFIAYVDDLFCYALTNLDTDAQDGVTYGRLANADLYSSAGVNRLGLRIPGSGHTLGDQRNLLLQTWGGMRSVLSNSPISFSISGTTVNFSVAAVTLQGAGSSLPYAASSGSVTQAAGTTATYFLYYIDDAQAGGSLPLHITTNPGGPASWPNGMLLGSATVTVASGGGGSSGTGGGGGGYCVADDMFIAPGRLAGDAEIGDPFDCIDLPTLAGKHVRALQGVSRGVEECVRIITNDGCALVCSVSTPFDLPDGRNTTAPHLLGEQVITDLGTATVISLALVGPKPVTRAHLGGVSYAAGADPHRRIYSHNAGVVKP